MLGPQILLDGIDHPESVSLKWYRSVSGYHAAERVLKTLKPDQIIEEVKASGLRGRGGAGFPAGVKWSFVPKGDMPKFLLCNANEGEPGTFKDRVLLSRMPHRLFEGMIIAAYVINARNGYIYIRGEFAREAQILEKALAEAYGENLLGKNLFGTGFDFDLTVYRGAGAYVCGEETATLIEQHQGESYQLHEQYLNTQMVRVLRTIGFDKTYVRGEGPYLYDMEGNRYLDLLSGFGVFALGRNHPTVRAALQCVIEADLPNLVQMDVTTLAGLLINRGKVDAAYPMLEEALRVQEASLDPDDPELARTLNNIGSVFRSKKEYDKALPYLERSLAIREKHFGPNSLDPRPGQTVNVTAQVRTSGGAPVADGLIVPGSWSFSLVPPGGGQARVTSYPGEYTNDPARGDAGNDFTYTYSVTSGNLVTITLTCRDFGGGRSPCTDERRYRRVTCRTPSPRGCSPCPKDSDGDGLPDAWEAKYGDLKPDEDNDGDGLTNLEEYRGFMWGPPLVRKPAQEPSVYARYQTDAFVPEGAAEHFRTNPMRKDLFVKVTGFDFNVGNPM